MKEWDRSGLPSETLKSRVMKEMGIGGSCRRDHFKQINALVHRLNVPLQVFFGEPTPTLETRSESIAEGLHN